MSNSAFAWEPMLATDAPDTCVLKSALFTTYDRPDERLLAEHLLPSLLRLGHEPDGEGIERQYFLLELNRRLRQLHDRIVVISSNTQEESSDLEQPESGTYGWIWRYIRQATVGRDRKAVQHAKLWLLHWGSVENDSEYLEVVISSTNLTRAAFRTQLQAAWRVCIELQPKASSQRLQRWGILPHFVEALFRSAGESTHFERYRDLLARAVCPGGISFVASVPGSHSKQSLRKLAWGAAGLGTVAPLGRGPVRAEVLCPFVGSWTESSLDRWCAKFGGSPRHLSLIWIDKEHPWARERHWLLPVPAYRSLKQAGSSLRYLPHPNGVDKADFRFHEEQRPADDRWSHAKLYLLRRGTSRRLLLTSANFSEAAWGIEKSDGELTIENFELGVCIEQASWPFEHLAGFPSDVTPATVLVVPSFRIPNISWARANWNGKKVSVSLRCEPTKTVKGEVIGNGKRVSIASGLDATRAHFRSINVSWMDSRKPPSWVRLICEGQRMDVAVFDERKTLESENIDPKELGEGINQQMQDDLLFEQYGGNIAVEEDGVVNGDVSVADGKDGRQPPRPDSYEVPSFVAARTHLQVVDTWVHRTECAAKSKTAEFERNLLWHDGVLLTEAFRRRSKRDGSNGIGARIAADELALRLKHIRVV
jgi:hypothetical protein